MERERERKIKDKDGERERNVEKEREGHCQGEEQQYGAKETKRVVARERKALQHILIPWARVADGGPTLLPPPWPLPPRSPSHLVV